MAFVDDQDKMVDFRAHFGVGLTCIVAGAAHPCLHCVPIMLDCYHGVWEDVHSEGDLSEALGKSRV